MCAICYFHVRVLSLFSIDKCNRNAITFISFYQPSCMYMQYGVTYIFNYRCKILIVVHFQDVASSPSCSVYFHGMFFANTGSLSQS